MHTKLLLLIVLFLTSCAVPTTPVPTSTLTLTPEPTATTQPTETLTATSTPTETPVPQYEVSTDPRFEKLGMPVYEIPAGDHFNGNLQSFLEANAEPFDPTQVIVEPLTVFTNMDGTGVSFVKYKDEQLKKWTTPEAKCFRKSQTIGHTVSGIYEYLALPVEFTFPDGNKYFVDTVLIIDIHEGKAKGSMSADQIANIVNKWYSNPGLYLSMQPVENLQDELVAKSQLVYTPEILAEKSKEFANTLTTTGDPTKIAELSKPGVVLYAFIPLN